MAIKLNINESKSMEFDINVSGVSAVNLKGFIRLMYEGIEYGFPVTIIGNDTIKAEIPPLCNIIKGDIDESKSIKSKLEIIANDTYIVPWEDDITVETPLAIEAKFKDKVQEVSKPGVSVINIDAKKGAPKKKEVTVKKKTKLSEMLNKK